MSLERKDLAKQTIAPDIHAILKAYADAHSQTIQSVVEQVLGAWADKRLHELTVMHSALVVSGVIPERQVAARNKTRIAGDAE